MNHNLLLLGTLALATGSLHAPPVEAAETIRCESNAGRYQSCNVDTRGGVQLSRQLSSEGCWQNDTWGYDSNRIWVTHGCRAEFVVGDSGARSGSGGNVAAGVAVAALIGAAILAGKDKDRDGDRYDGQDYRPGYGGYRPQSTFRCESTNQRQVYCPIPYRGHVEVYRQVSKSTCQYGVTWGVDGRNVWVNNGCRADFAVY